MDTLFYRKKKPSSSLILTAFFITIFICSNPAICQKNDQTYRFGSGMETSISFDGHGSFYSVYGSIGNSKNSLKVGPMLQKRYTNVNGIKLSYSRFLTGLSRRLVYADEIKPVGGPFRLNFFSYIQYINKAHLSYNGTRVEMKMNPENITDWNSVKLSTIEGALGFELVTKITEQFCIRNYVGLNVYYHTNYHDGMYHEKAAPSLVFGAAIDIPRF